MPNHVTTIIKPDCEAEQFNIILSLITNNDGKIDFNKIIEIDDEFNNFEPTSEVVSRAKNAIGIPVDEHCFFASLERSNRVRDCFALVNKDDIDNIIKAIQLYKKLVSFTGVKLTLTIGVQNGMHMVNI